MREVVIGSVAGVSAVLLTWVLRPAPAPGRGAAVVRELQAGDRAMIEELAQPYLPPTTRLVDPARRRLDRVVPGVDVTKMPLTKVLGYVGEASGVNLHVNWRALEAAGIEANEPVTLKVQNVPAVQLLKRVLADAGGGNIMLTYRVEEGVVEVSTAEDLSRHTVTRVYDVRDLIDDALARDRRLNGAAAKRTEAAVADELMLLIKESVEPLTWDGPPFVRYFGGRLIVTWPPEQQDAAQGILTALRRAR
jgi:hypothetical protein